MKQLSAAERMRLLKFVCSFAWTDLRISDEERAVVRRLVDHFGFEQDERSQVARWLAVPPAPEEIDPTEVPHEHRQLFVAAVREVLEADGVTLVEHDGFELFQELLA